MGTTPDTGTVIRSMDDERSVADLRFPVGLDARLAELFPDHEPASFRELIEGWAEQLDLAGGTPSLADFYADDADSAELEIRVAGAADGAGPGLELEEGADRFCCPLGPMVLSFLFDDPLELESTCPETGNEVTLRMEAGGVETSSPETVVSFGAPADLPDREYGSDLTATQEQLAPYVRLFASRDAYDRWVTATDGVTVGLSAEAAHELAREAYWAIERAAITSSSLDCDCLLVERPD